MTAALTDMTDAVPAGSSSRSVRVQRSTNGGLSWADDGSMAWDGARYSTTRTLYANTRYRALFDGDEPLQPTTSGIAAISVKASLSTPVVSPGSPKHGKKFTVTGVLKPRHSGGYVTLYFYKKGSTKAALYKKFKATGTVTGGSKYTLIAKVPTKGKWIVKAYHSDSDHAATWSAPRSFSAK